MSIPPRRYDLAAEILAEVLEADSADPPLESLGDVAAEYGRQIGRRTRARNGGSRLLAALNVIGYEPVTSGDDVVLRNCPFSDVAQARPEIICQMNLAFVAGVLAGTQTRSLHAVLSPSTERCCVVVTS